MISESKYLSIMKKLDYLTWFMHKNVSREENERWLAGVFFNLNGYYPNFKAPLSFNEKIGWLRLNYCSEDIVRAVDKVEFESYVAEKVGEGYTAKKYGVYQDPMDVKFEILPQKFVLKSSYSSSSKNILFITDKSNLDVNKVRYQMSEWLQPWNSSAKSFSCWYRDAKPRILVEELLEDSSGHLKDYKFMCFNGVPKFLFVISDRFNGGYADFFDLDWNHLPVKQKFDNAPFTIERPSGFDRMVELARTLSKDFLFVRVDFYQIRERVLVGELTFSPAGGLEPFTPVEWDYKFGEMLSLSVN